MAEEGYGVEGLLTQVADRIKIGLNEAVFGPSRTVGNRTVIPVAKLSYGFGAGAGKGTSPAPRGPAVEGQTELSPTPGSGEGGGGGGGVRARPVAVIEISPDGVRVIPVIDVQRLATLAAALVGMLLLMRLLRR